MDPCIMLVVVVDTPVLADLTKPMVAPAELSGDLTPPELFNGRTLVIVITIEEHTLATVVSG